MSDATSLQQQRWAGAKMKIQVVWNFECPKLALEPPENWPPHVRPLWCPLTRSKYWCSVYTTIALRLFLALVSTAVPRAYPELVMNTTILHLVRDDAVNISTPK